MSEKLGIIGLGRCGMPAAEKFLQSGYEVCGYARRPEVIAAFEKLGGKHAPNPAEVAKNSDVVIILVLNDEQVIEVVTGENGVLSGASQGLKLVCMSTINRSNLEFVANRCIEKGIRFVDCPFTGGPARIPPGTLTLIAAAPKDLLDEVEPVMDRIGNITVAGDTPGMGQAVKHCNQLLVTAIHAATIELIVLAEKTGADPKFVCDVVGSGIGGNDYFKLLSGAIIDKTTSPGGMGQLWKDVNIIINSAREHNLPLLVATATSQYFNMAVSQGLADDDSYRMIDVFRRMIDE